MKKIMFVTWSSAYGGAEKIICFLANSFAQSNRYDTVLYIYEADSELFWNIHPDVKVITEKTVSKKRVLRRFLQVKQVYSRIKKEKPDIIVSFLTFPNIICTIVGKMAKIPVIVSERGDPKIVSEWMKKIVARADGAVFQTDGAKRDYPEGLQRKSVVIPNPVVIPKKDDIKTEYRHTHIISNIARQLNCQKRQDLLLQAFATVLNVYPDSVLHFYGDGPDETKNKELAASLGVLDHVIFHGVTKNALEKIKESDVFVLSSDYEGIPNSLLEAMSIGVPVVSTDCSPGGARLLIKNGENGILVPCGEKDLLSDAIINLFDDTALAERYGKEGRKVCDTFHPNVIVDKWMDYVNKYI